MTNGSRIAVLLPYAENFSPLKAGAVSLFVYETSLQSTYRSDITVFGKDGVGAYEKIRYRGLIPKFRWLLGRNIGTAAAFYNAIKNDVPDIIEIHNRPQVLLYLTRKLPTAKIVMYFHNDPCSMKDSETPEQRTKILEKATEIYCVSNYIRERFLSGTDAPDNLKEKIKTVYNGIRRLSEDVPEKDDVILYAGRLVEEKGIAELAEAVSRVLPRFPNWKFVVVGAKRHGQYGKGTSDFEKKLYHLFDKIGPQAEILGHRPYDQVLQLYRKAALVVVPSKWDEPLGRTAIEALSEYCALISSDRGGLKEINDGCGIILKDVTVDEIAEKLNLLMSDENLLKETGRKCGGSFEKFRLENIVSLIDAYRKNILQK